jgi:DNA replication protein DnaC
LGCGYLTGRFSGVHNWPVLGVHRGYGVRSTIITSQLPPAQWHDYLADATLADAICDRLLHNAHRIVLKGPSRRKEAKLDD